jgi:hypothetical protein
MNKKIEICKSAQERLDRSLRKALGERGRNLLEQKKIKVVYIDGEWWIIGMTKEAGGESA